MRKAFKIEYLPIAYEDLEDIFYYVALDSPAEAENLLNRFDEAICRLESFPEMGALPKNQRLIGKGYRMLVIDDYLVFYVLQKDVIEIRRIVSGKRFYSKLL